jgi:hypothetical protein
VRYAALARAVLTLAAREVLPDGIAGLDLICKSCRWTAPWRSRWRVMAASSGRCAAWIPTRWVTSSGSAFTDIESRAGSEFPCFLAWHGLDPAWEGNHCVRALRASEWLERRGFARIRHAANGSSADVAAHEPSGKASSDHRRTVGGL